MDKTIRCTVCTWRGSWQDAVSMPPPRASQIPPPLESIQSALGEKQQTAAAQFGVAQPPPCPVCGHHTMVVKLHSIRPVT